MANPVFKDDIMEGTAPFGNVAWMRSRNLLEGGLGCQRRALHLIGRHLAMARNHGAPLADRVGAALRVADHFRDVLCRDKLEKPITVLMLMVADEREHPDLRRACSFALGSSGSMQALSAIQSIMKYSEALFPKLLAIKALGMLQLDEKRELLMDIADKNGSEELRCAALRELARVDRPSARQIVFDEGTYASWSLRSMRRINDALEGNDIN